MADIQYLVTTMGLRHEDMLSLARKMNLDGDAIIRSQCGRDGGCRSWHVEGKHLLTIEASDIGLSKNRNELLSLATGLFVSFLDDDVTLPSAYSEGVGQMFLKLRADAIRFPLEGRNSRADLPFGKRLRLRHVAAGYMSAYVFLRSSLVSAVLKFDERIGAGKSVSCGEDNVFLRDALKHGLRIYAGGPGKSLRLREERPSTWFHGHDAQFFFSKGYIYRRLYPLVYPLFLLRSAIRWKADGLPFWKRLGILRRGAKEEARVARTGTDPALGRYRKYGQDGNPPRILVMTHLPLSWDDSNGRTILELLSSVGEDNVVNFHIAGSPSGKCCRSYFSFTDKDAVRSSFCLDGGREETIRDVCPKAGSAKIRKSMATLLLRDFAWRLSRPLTKSVRDWLQKESPDLILLLSSDFPAFAELAGKISRELKVPVVHYNAEEYLEKDYDFLSNGSAKGKRTALSRIYLRRLRRVYVKAYRDSYVIHLTENLLREYDEIAPPRKSCWIGNSSDMKPVSRDIGSIRKVFYFGNLGHLRWKGLVEIKDALVRNGFSGNFHVYGKGEKSEVEELSRAGILYEGFLPYETLMNRVKEEADLLVHCESFDPYCQRDVRNGFSTKIPDMLALGIPCLFYAPESYRFVQYLRSNGSHFVASTEGDLDACAARLLGSSFPYGCPERQGNIALAEKNHSAAGNGKRFLEFVSEALEGQE